MPVLSLQAECLGVALTRIQTLQYSIAKPAGNTQHNITLAFEGKAARAGGKELALICRGPKTGGC